MARVDSGQQKCGVSENTATHFFGKSLVPWPVVGMWSGHQAHLFCACTHVTSGSSAFLLCPRTLSGFFLSEEGYAALAGAHSQHRGPAPRQKKNRRATRALLSPFIMHDAQSDEISLFGFFVVHPEISSLEHSFMTSTYLLDRLPMQSLLSLSLSLFLSFSLSLSLSLFTSFSLSLCLSFSSLSLVINSKIPNKVLWTRCYLLTVLFSWEQLPTLP